MSFFQDLKQKLEKSVETAGQKSQQMLEMSRLAIRIKGKKDDVERSVARLGWEVFRAWKDKGEPVMTEEVRKLLEEIKDQQHQLSVLERELEELRNSLVTLRETAEKVDVGAGKEDTLPDSAGTEADRRSSLRKPEMEIRNAGKREETSSGKPKTPPAGEVKAASASPAVSSVVYICPFCARQVPAEASECPHCRQRFF